MNLRLVNERLTEEEIEVLRKNQIAVGKYL